jgi:hypothetical protein
MTSNPESIVQQLQDDFQNLLVYITGPDARAQTAYTVELTLFRRLLALGAVLLRLFCVTWAAVRPAEPVTAPDGTRLSALSSRAESSRSRQSPDRFRAWGRVPKRPCGASRAPERVAHLLLSRDCVNWPNFSTMRGKRRVREQPGPLLRFAVF